MEPIKGRVKAINGPVERMKKDQSGTYVMTEVDVQIGVYKRTKADYATNTFNVVDEPEMIRKAYFGDEANNIGNGGVLSVGDVVSVKMHTYVSQYGRNELVIDSILPANAKAKAMEQSQAPAPKAEGDELPF